LIFFIIGMAFTGLSIDYYVEVGRINPNTTIIAAGTIVIAILLLIASVLFYSLTNIVRDKKFRDD